MSQAEDWTKFVTLNPPNCVKFKIHEKDKEKGDLVKLKFFYRSMYLIIWSDTDMIVSITEYFSS